MGNQSVWIFFEVFHSRTKRTQTRAAHHTALFDGNGARSPRLSGSHIKNEGELQVSACACDAILMGMGGSRATGGSWYQDPLVPMSAKNSKSSHELPKPPIPRQALGMSSGCTHPHLVVAVKFGFDTRRRASSGFVPQIQPLGRVPTKIDACYGTDARRHRFWAKPLESASTIPLRL